jgi:hypothetical protein
VYALLWRALPGPRWLRALEALLLFTLVVLLLFTVVFPWLQPRLPFSDVTVDAAPANVGTRAPWID